ncbi:Pilus assembly protein cpaE [Candidatus Filomicrobium marinum]|uniref:Pilus assembly protein cpaE n=2 Tax=Filomicrobium TaxID=119044 RepID=A0A0D6JFU6_9HYPH|nr:MULTISPECIES: AAA family ATPase [Filomicrobium]MCV0370301.1 AAA family ATPase [Filomicrobium sp.]CFX22447.1 Pilus assembly protein cpaE [Candidatus Filomicrobium marinum]CPR18918.1 Pilus assembly protein cpaE [Candidatus Filomicrobium marinum]SDO12559.1 pilus assembly protein CpaE [Filomicrobium insigne]
MSNQAHSLQQPHVSLDIDEVLDAADRARDLLADRARPIPRISIQAFCESALVAETLQTAAEDRRLSKAHVSINMGGIPAAIAHFEENPTPNLIIIESGAEGAQLLAELDHLADSCDAGTKVIIVGQLNDVILYRELLKRGVSEYLLAPIGALQVMESISNLYNDPDSDPVGHVYAFIGAKGGVGSSTVCHNTAWALSEALQSSVIITDMDLPFGTTGLDFNQDPMQGVADALVTPERLDEVLLDRLLTKCSEHLSIFSAPAVLDRDFNLNAEACDQVVDVVRQNVPYVAIDIPHTWTDWSKRLLLQADEVVITASPDLANLRNAKNIVELLRAERRHDSPPQLVLNMTKMPKRPEISTRDFEQALELVATAEIEFDTETFGQAANNGQMIEEMNAKAKSVQNFRDLAMRLAHRQEVRHERKSPFAPLLEKLKLGR